jgi:predicted DNA-binding transcriptional regulator AlpA
MTKAAYTVSEFLEAFGLGRTKFYELVNAGQLKARKNGTKTVVLAADAQAWLDSLPAVEPKKAA